MLIPLEARPSKSVRSISASVDRNKNGLVVINVNYSRLPAKNHIPSENTSYEDCPDGLVLYASSGDIQKAFFNAYAESLTPDQMGFSFVLSSSSDHTPMDGSHAQTWATKKPLPGPKLDLETGRRYFATNLKTILGY